MESSLSTTTPPPAGAAEPPLAPPLAPRLAPPLAWDDEGEEDVEAASAAGAEEVVESEASEGDAAVEHADDE